MKKTKMKIKSRNSLFTNFLIIVLASSCIEKKQSDTSEQSNLEIRDLFQLDNETLNQSQWVFFESFWGGVFLPVEWERYNTEEVWLFSWLNDELDDTFFVCTFYAKDSEDVSAINLLSQLHKSAEADSSELLREYELVELEWTNKRAYFCKYITQKDSGKYAFFQMVWDDGKRLYDLGLKVAFSEKEKYYELFQKVVFNTVIEDKRYLSNIEDLKMIRSVEW